MARSRASIRRGFPKNDQESEAVGRSRGGFESNNPGGGRGVGAPGQLSRSGQVLSRTGEVEADDGIADPGADSNQIIE